MYRTCKPVIIYKLTMKSIEQGIPNITYNYPDPDLSNLILYISIKLLTTHRMEQKEFQDSKYIYIIYILNRSNKGANSACVYSDQDTGFFTNIQSLIVVQVTLLYNSYQVYFVESHRKQENVIWNCLKCP